MFEIELLQGKLGYINLENQYEYCSAFARVDNWTQEEILAWFAIFEREDDDDYGALAWDLVVLAEKHLNSSGHDNLKMLGNYWSMIALIEPYKNEWLDP